MVLKDLGTWLGDPQPAFSFGGAGGSEWHQGFSQSGGSWPFQQAGGTWRSTDSRKEYRGPRRSSTRTPSTFLAKAQQAREAEVLVAGSSETVGPWKESEAERTVGPRQGLSRTSTALLQRQECSQYQSHPEATLLLTGYCGTLRNPLVPEDHRAPYLQTTLPEVHPWDWPGHEDRCQVPGVCHGSLTRNLLRLTS